MLYMFVIEDNINLLQSPILVERKKMAKVSSPALLGKSNHSLKTIFILRSHHLDKHFHYHSYGELY